MQKVVTTGYVPRPLQALIHRSLKRFNVLVCHRRFGKTHLAINEIIDRGLRCPNSNPQYAYIAPTYGQAKRVAWDLLKNYLRDIPGVTFNETELRADIDRPALRDRVRILLLGAENPDTLKGIYLDGIVFDEYASMASNVWTEVVRPALSDRLGWAVFIGTPKGTNHFYEIYNTATKMAAEGGEWFAAKYKASETGVIPRSELEAARATMDEHEYEQEFECSFSAALVGSYFGKELSKAEAEGRISRVPHDPALPVITAWDLGVSDTTVIWFAQIISKEVRIIRHLEMSGEGLDYYVQQLMKLPYTYGTAYLPHDAAARELGTGKTREETLRKLGLRNIVVVPRTRSKADDINAARLLIRKCWFNAEMTRGLDALRNYQRTWDAKNGMFQERPKHDWSSHSADAFMTLAMGLDENRPGEETIKNYPRQTVSDYDIFEDRSRDNKRLPRFSLGGL